MPLKHQGCGGMVIRMSARIKQYGALPSWK
jgi:hypothetical protein